jgi:hypothetical protein
MATARVLTAGYAPLNPSGKDTVIAFSPLNEGSYVVFATAQVSLGIAPGLGAPGGSDMSVATFRLTLDGDGQAAPVAEDTRMPLLFQTVIDPRQGSDEPTEILLKESMSLMVAGALPRGGSVKLGFRNAVPGLAGQVDSATVIALTVDDVVFGPQILLSRSPIHLGQVMSDG